MLVPALLRAMGGELDASQGDQAFYEDCMACCKPIHLRLHLDEARDCLQLFMDADDEQMF